jgi:hypothetical protein
VIALREFHNSPTLNFLARGLSKHQARSDGRHPRKSGLFAFMETSVATGKKGGDREAALEVALKELAEKGMAPE